jgi:sugar O-acyltransferase (sialic acid O-acetyltransferase NeuD family)
MRSLVVVGAGWYAAEVAGWAEDAGWHVAGLAELLNTTRIGITHEGYRVVDLDGLEPGTSVVVAGGGDRRAAWERAERRGCVATTVLHPSAQISRSAVLESGTLVGPLAVVGARTAIDEHVILSRGALVGHHVRVGAFSRLMPGANLAGHVQLGTDATIGMSAAVADYGSVGERAVVAAGAMVVRPVAADTRVQGVPARVYEP